MGMKTLQGSYEGCDGKALIFSDIFGKAVLAQQPCKLKPELKDRDRDREDLLGKRLLMHYPQRMLFTSLHWF